MATFTAHLVEGIDSGNIEPRWSSSPVFPIDSNWSSQSLMNFSVALAAPYTPGISWEHTQQEHVQPPVTAHLAPTFANDMYNRLWFIPDPVDFGYILGATIRDFMIWNAYLTVEMTCVGVVYSDTLQFSVDGPQPTFTLPAIGMYNYTATAFAEGGFTFNVLSTWDFVSEDLLGSFIGTRVVLLDYEPLYKSMDELLLYASDIIQSFNGKEQRIQTRQLPRREFSFSFRIETERIQADWEALLFQWQKKAFGIPQWGEAAIHEDVITAGDTVITIDTAYANFEVDGLAVIWQGRDRYEPIQILSFTPTAITTAFPITKTFTGEKFIMPVVPCHMPSNPKWTPTPDEDAEVTVNLAAIEPDNPTDSWSWPMTFESLPVLIDPSIVRKKGMKRYNDGEMSVVDYTTGDFTMFSDTEFVREINAFRFRRETKETVWDLRLLMHYLKGKQKPIFIPSHKKDFTLTGIVVIWGTSFIAEGNLIYRNYYVNDLKKYIQFRNIESGQIYHDEISSMTSDGTNTTVFLAGVGGVPWQMTNQNTIISWLDKVRLISDVSKIKWERIGEAECVLKFITVEE